MLQYLLEVTLCWTLFYAIFFALLRKITFYRVNRWYLLGALVMGLIIPLLKFIDIELHQEEVADIAPLVYVVKEAPEFIAHTVIEQTTDWHSIITHVLSTIYLLGLSLFLARFIKGLYTIYGLYKNGTKINHDHHTVVNTSQPHLPFSFLNVVFISDTLPLKEDINDILRHELAHVESRHSIDVLLLEIINILFWFHPMIYLYKTAIRQTHEYLADAVVLENTSRKIYGNILLKQSLSGIQVALAHHFFHSHIKKRINMMYQKKSGQSAWLKYSLALPVLIVLFIVFSGYQSQEVYTTKDLLLEWDMPGTLSHSETPVYLYVDQEEVETSPQDCKRSRIMTDGFREAISNYKLNKNFLIVFDDQIIKRNVTKHLSTHKGILLKELSILHPDRAKELYGSRGKYGAVEMRSPNARDLTQFEYLERMPDFPKFSTFLDETEHNKSPLIYVDDVLLDLPLSKHFSLDKDFKITGSSWSNPERALRAYGEKGKNGVLHLFGVTQDSKSSLEFPYLNTHGSNSVQFYYNGIEISFSSIQEEQKHRSQFNSIEILTEASAIRKLSSVKPNVIFNYFNNKNGQIIRNNGKDTKIKNAETVAWYYKLQNTPDNISIRVENRDGVLLPIYKFYGAHEDLNTSTISESNLLVNDESFSGDHSVIDLGTPIIPVRSIVVVTSNGTKLTENSDYKVNYEEGKITITNQSYIGRDIPINISFKYDGDADEDVDETWVDPMGIKWNFGKEHKRWADIVSASQSAAIKELSKKLIKGTTENGQEEQENDKIYKVVSNMPQVRYTNNKKESDKELARFIKENLVYPPEAYNQKKEGKEFVQFIVEKDGSITNIEALRKLKWGMKEEAVRIIKKMAAELEWIPGKNHGEVVRVSYVIPVEFKLSQSHLVPNTPFFRKTKQEKRTNWPPPLYVVDGVEMPKGAKLENVEIELFEMLSDEDAIKQYGEKGKDGVILATSKSNEDIEYFEIIEASDTLLSFITKEKIYKGVTDMPLIGKSKDIHESHKTIKEYIKKNFRLSNDMATHENGIYEGVNIIIEKNGKASHIEAVMIGTAPSLKKEAERVIRKMSDELGWQAGKDYGVEKRVQFYIPIKLEMPTGANPTRATSDKDPLFVIDGVVTNKRAENIDPKDIESIEVIKDEKATEQYGEAGKNGVILITTKDGLKKREATKIKVIGSNENKKLDYKDFLHLLVIDETIFLEGYSDIIGPNKNIKKQIVLTSSKQIEPYGQAGKNGVIKLTMKKPRKGIEFIDKNNRMSVKKEDGLSVVSFKTSDGHEVIGKAEKIFITNLNETETNSFGLSGEDLLMSSQMGLSLHPDNIEYDTTVVYDQKTLVKTMTIEPSVLIESPTEANATNNDEIDSSIKLKAYAESRSSLNVTFESHNEKDVTIYIRNIVGMLIEKRTITYEDARIGQQFSLSKGVSRILIVTAEQGDRTQTKRVLMP